MAIRYFKSGGNQLSYTCELPSVNENNTGILFVHAAGGNRLGPHRMFVEMARMYVKMGYATFRFDMRGCGDSSGKYNEYEIGPDVIDTVSAIRYFIDIARLEKVILVGISKGARVCHTIMSKYSEPLDGLILLSTSIINNRRALNHFVEQCRIYKHKFLQIDTFQRMMTGKINVKHIAKSLFWGINVAKQQKTQDSKSVFSECPVLLIYGEKDPIFKSSYEFYAKLLLKNKIDYKCHTIPGANHSFYHYKWKEEILMVSSEWLRQINYKERQC